MLTSDTDYGKPFDGAAWFDVVLRQTALPELSPQVLLHAGPPYRGTPPAATLNAAVQALLFEALADHEAAARGMLESGAVQLRPAQDYGIVTPLAQVVSASMPLAAVKQGDRICYGALVEGTVPALRFGSRAPECRERLRDLRAWVLRSVAPLLRSDPLDIAAVIRHAVATGDECHARTGQANDALVSALSLDAHHAAALSVIPAFVLPIIMAAAVTALRTQHSTIDAIGGNGIDVGFRRRDERHRGNRHRGDRSWQQFPAEAPRGSRFSGLDAVDALPAIGDSMVIDFCGLGGQALAAAPLLAAEWHAVLPPDALDRRHTLIDPQTGIVDPQRISGRVAPIINLAILDRVGTRGLIGRGFFIPPSDLFSTSP